jgi:hypothetical protein
MFPEMVTRLPALPWRRTRRPLPASRPGGRRALAKQGDEGPRHVASARPSPSGSDAAGLLREDGCQLIRVERGEFLRGQLVPEAADQVTRRAERTFERHLLIE